MQKHLKKTAEQANAHNKSAYKNILKSIPLFSEFSEEDINIVLNNAYVKTYHKDNVLFLTGDKAEFFYIIINGWIKLYRETKDGHESVISVLTNGEVFGKSAITKNSSYPYTAETISDNTIVLQLPSSFMMKMREDHQHFNAFIAKLIESDINEINQLHLETEHLAQMTSAERVGCFLLKLCSTQHEGSISFQLPYEKSLAAGRLGMTPETFSRSLNQLTAIGVETKNSTITIHNIAQLRSYVCEHCSAIQEDCKFEKEEAV